MAFTPQNAEVVFRVLVTVLHLDHVARELRFASARQILLVALLRISGLLRTAQSLRPHRPAPSLRDCIHVVSPPLTRAARLSMGQPLQ
jgi:hypothetical protein